MYRENDEKEETMQETNAMAVLVVKGLKRKKANKTVNSRKKKQRHSSLQCEHAQNSFLLPSLCPKPPNKDDEKRRK